MGPTSTTADEVTSVEKHSSGLFDDRLLKLEQRQWWLWSSTIATLILLTVAVASFAFPSLLRQEDYSYSLSLNQGVRALVGIVMLFAVYLVYQQNLMTRMRRQIADQVRSLTRVENLTSEVYKLAALDQLTEIYNRRSGEQRLAEEISRATRNQCPLTVLLLDLDGLKQINDEFGHAAGDLVLQQFAERLQKASRGSDVAVRLGGDEFMLVLPQCPEDEIERVLGRIRSLKVIEYDGALIPCRFSRGWTMYKVGESADDFLKRADEALYLDKHVRKENGIAVL